MFKAKEVVYIWQSQMSLLQDNNIYSNGCAVSKACCQLQFQVLGLCMSANPAQMIIVSVPSLIALPIQQHWLEAGKCVHHQSTTGTNYRLSHRQSVTNSQCINGLIDRKSFNDGINSLEEQIFMWPIKRDQNLSF